MVASAASVRPRAAAGRWCDDDSSLDPHRVDLYDHDLRRRLNALLSDEQGTDGLPLHSGDLLPDLHRLTDRAMSDAEQVVQNRAGHVDSPLVLRVAEVAREVAFEHVNPPAGVYEHVDAPVFELQRCARVDSGLDCCPWRNGGVVLGVIAGL